MLLMMVVSRGLLPCLASFFSTEYDRAEHCAMAAIEFGRTAQAVAYLETLPRRRQMERHMPITSELAWLRRPRGFEALSSLWRWFPESLKPAYAKDLLRGALEDMDETLLPKLEVLTGEKRSRDTLWAPRELERFFDLPAADGFFLAVRAVDGEQTERAIQDLSDGAPASAALRKWTLNHWLCRAGRRYGAACLQLKELPRDDSLACRALANGHFDVFPRLFDGRGCDSDDVLKALRLAPVLPRRGDEACLQALAEAEDCDALIEGGIGRGGRDFLGLLCEYPSFATRAADFLLRSERARIDASPESVTALFAAQLPDRRRVDEALRAVEQAALRAGNILKARLAAKGDAAFALSSLLPLPRGTPTRAAAQTW